MHCDPNPQLYTSLWIQHDEAIGFFFRHLIACGNGTAKSISEFSITPSGRRFVEFNLVKTTFGRIRPSPGRYDIRSNTSSAAAYMYKTVSKLSIIDGVRLLTVLS